MINRIEQSHSTWLWAAADAREGIAQPLSDKFAQSLLQHQQDFELNRALNYGLLCGLRMFECKNFEVVNKSGIFCFSLPARRGYQARLVPISEKLVELPKLEKSAGNLSNKFRKLPEWTGNQNKILFFALHLTFRMKLKQLGLDAEFINALSGWNPKINWTQDNLKECKNIIDRVSYETQ